MKDRKVKITVPIDIDYLPILLNAVGNIAKLSGFDKDDISKLETATEEAVSNVIRADYDKCEESTFDMILVQQTMGLLIIVEDNNLLSIESEKKSDVESGVLLSKSKYEEISNTLIKQLMDKLWFRTNENNNFETHFFKYLKKYNLHVSSQEATINNNKEEVKQLSEKTVSYVVRRMKPEEAIDVSRVAYSSYGNTYLHSNIYYPNRIRELNVKNQLMSFLAVTTDDKIIAHIAFERSADKWIPEIGMAFTKPEYRGIGCMNRLMSDSMEAAKKLSFNGIFSQGVTSHPYSQKSLNKYGFKDCGLLLSIFHELSMEAIDQEKLQRESVMVSYRYLKSPETLIIYPPEHHAEMIADLYENIGFKPEIRKPNMLIEPDSNKSILNVKTDLDNNTADITINTIGKNIIVHVRRTLDHLCHNNIATIYLRMKLSDHNMARYTTEIEKMGFFFSGILPRSNANDELILQYLNNYVIDFDLLKIYSDKGKEIFEYVKKCVYPISFS